MQNAQMITVIIGCALTFIGLLIIFLLGIVVSYIRSNAENTKNFLIILSEHKIRLENHDRDIQQLFSFHNRNKP